VCIRSELNVGFKPLTGIPNRSRTDWWTWTDDPNTTDGEQQLALDPACGVETRPLLTDMLSFAARRRDGQHPAYDQSWGAAICNLPDLKTFELILETFLEKKRQLEVVVDCAKTWKFSLKETQYEMVCDGTVEDLRWTNATNEKDSWENETDTGSALMDIDESDCSSDEQSEDHGTGEESSHGGGYIQDTEDSVDVRDLMQRDAEMAANAPQSHAQPSQALRLDTTVGGYRQSSIEPQAKNDSAPVNGRFSPLDTYTPTRAELTEQVQSPTYSPVWTPGSNHSSFSGQYWSPTSPRYSPTSPLSQQAWYRSSTEFEVKIVRFRRSRVSCRQGSPCLSENILLEH
jgi:hypothetical protein